MHSQTQFSEAQAMNTRHLRAVRRYILVFIAIALLPLALIYLVRHDQLYRFRGYQAANRNDHFSDHSFRYPVMLLGKSKDLTVVATGKSRKRHTKHEKYINESHLPVLSDDAIVTLSPNELQKVQKTMDTRRKLVLERCTEYGLDVLGNDSLHKPNAWEFLVNRQFHIVWCNIFKAASSSWMFNFNILAGYSPEYLRKTKEVLLNLARERYPRVSLNELREAQNDSITFLIARHPFERLLSAYRDKFVFALPHSYHDKLGRRIVHIYRKRKPHSSHGPKHPTFSEFVRWLLDELVRGNAIDMHFVSATRFCTPCLINIDMILKFETLEQDQLYLIEKAGLKHVIAPEWRNMGKGKNTRELLETYYSQLTQVQLDGLYEYYRYDFELFNYSAEDYYHMVKSQPLTQFSGTVASIVTSAKGN